MRDFKVGDRVRLYDYGADAIILAFDNGHAWLRFDSGAYSTRLVRYLVRIEAEVAHPASGRKE